MGFQQGLSGLNAAAKKLDVVGNNVANASTVGFKAGGVAFSDVYAASMGGSNAQPGMGVRVAAVTQKFSQGSVTASSNPLDMAVNGNGMFRLLSNGVPVYTRNGQFRADKEGFIVNAAGDKLTGYSVDANGNLVTGNPGPLRIDTGGANPRPTANMSGSMNLDSRAPIIAPAVSFSMSDSSTYTSSTTVSVFDSLGNPHNLQTYFRKTGESTWDVYASVDGDLIDGNNAASAPGDQPVGSFTFDTSGRLQPTAPSTPVMTFQMPMGEGAAPNQPITLDFSQTTQHGAPFSIDSLSQDGFAPGTLAGYSVGADGIIVGRYTNGTTATLGQVVLASFKNENGLVPIGGNNWSDSMAAGTPVVGAPGSGILGALTQGVEESNVDLTAELVDMIVAQRAYQANAQTVKAQDQIMQTMINLG